jgi:hypothetical protein
MYATNSPLSTLNADAVTEIYSHLDFPTKFSFGMVAKFTSITFRAKNECITFLEKQNRFPQSSRMSDIQKAFTNYKMFGPGLRSRKLEDCGYSPSYSYRRPNPIPREDPGYYYSWKGDAGPMLAEHELAVKQLQIK